MGCDIHGYIEYTSEAKIDKFWDVFASLQLHRNYVLFGVLAGVRTNETPLFPPKGMPKVLSWRVNSENSILVVEDEEYELCRREGEKVVKRSRANEWVEQGYSEYDKQKLFVTNPDWHSHSWLTLDELKKNQRSL